MVDPSADIIWKYINPEQKERDKIEMLGSLYLDLNQKVNVISRKDIGSLYLHHVLHSLALYKYDRFKPGSRILDMGTGGGFPGVPLAIMYPDCQFTLIDGTHKKIQIVKTVIDQLSLTNVTAEAIRAEDYKGSFDFVVSRAVASAPKIWNWCKHLLPSKKRNAITNTGPNVFLLKGGNLHAELKSFHLNYTLHPIQLYFEEAYFREKYILAF